MVRVEMTIGEETIVIETSGPGPIGQVLSQCKVTADVLMVLSEIQRAADIVRQARGYNFPCLSQRVMYERAETVTQDVGLSHRVLMKLVELPVKVLHTQTQ